MESQSACVLAWAQLEAYLRRHDSVDTNFQLRAIVADTILRLNPSMALPPWLIQHFVTGGTQHRFKACEPSDELEEAGDPVDARAPPGMGSRGADPSSLLRLYLKYDRLESAAQLAIDLMQDLAKQAVVPTQRQQHCAVWVPETLLSALDNRLKLQSEKCPHLEALERTLAQCIMHHQDTVHTDSQQLLAH
eukprot:CAMPEP_0197863482 /NCGR_PEP_ID=MMETSP1438-20131217/40960_1 /TAXON_ID=1461541 /ORGANISM="Pterosperma sp., Strain CCMP1384" /LENGTH=190 /DNA_ID=CAMNT_0043481385 /DNA_START=26 /DNA_END=598 /DNA_ORIENTATION=+